MLDSLLIASALATELGQDPVGIWVVRLPPDQTLAGMLGPLKVVPLQRLLNQRFKLFGIKVIHIAHNTISYRGPKESSVSADSRNGSSGSPNELHNLHQGQPGMMSLRQRVWCHPAAQ